MNIALIARTIDADRLTRILEIDAECAIGVDAEMRAGTAAIRGAIR